MKGALTHDTVETYLKRHISKATIEYYQNNPMLQTPAGLRCDAPRYIAKRTNLAPRKGFVFATIYAHDGPVMKEEDWRRQGQRVFEEVHFGNRNRPKASLVEVFDDGDWAEIDWNTHQRKHTQSSLAGVQEVE